MIEVNSGIENGDVHIHAVVNAVDVGRTVLIRLDAEDAGRQSLAGGANHTVGLDEGDACIPGEGPGGGRGTREGKTFQSVPVDVPDSHAVLARKLLGGPARVVNAIAEDGDVLTENGAARRPQGNGSAETRLHPCGTRQEQRGCKRYKSAKCPKLNDISHRPSPFLIFQSAESVQPLSTIFESEKGISPPFHREALRTFDFVSSGRNSIFPNIHEKGLPKCVIGHIPFSFKVFFRFWSKNRKNSLFATTIHATHAKNSGQTGESGELDEFSPARLFSPPGGHSTMGFHLLPYSQRENLRREPVQITGSGVRIHQRNRQTPWNGEFRLDRRIHHEDTKLTSRQSIKGVQETDERRKVWRNRTAGNADSIAFRLQEGNNARLTYYTEGAQFEVEVGRIGTKPYVVDGGDVRQHVCHSTSATIWTPLRRKPNSR